MTAHLRSVILMDPCPLRFSENGVLLCCATDVATASPETDPRNPLRVQLATISSIRKPARRKEYHAAGYDYPEFLLSTCASPRNQFLIATAKALVRICQRKLLRHA